TGFEIERRREIPRGHPDVVLLGAQAHLLARLHLAETLVAPGPRQLSGYPGVRGLSDREHAVLVVTQQHRSAGGSAQPFQQAAHASRNASTPTTRASHGLRSARTLRAISRVASALICTSTARNSSSLPPRKWWYRAPRVKPARCTISSVPTSA